MAELTGRMMVSSLFGHVAVGAAVAAFLPLIITNSVKRVNGTGPGFLATWLLADAFNLVGIIVLGAAVTQQALAAWYFLADAVMLVQLLAFGHDDLRWRTPQPVKSFVRIEGRKRKPWLHALSRQFEVFSAWDNVKLLSFCVIGGVAAWGAFLTLGLYNKHDTFAIEIPEGYKPASFWLGLMAILIFSAARIPEFMSGRARSNRNEKPTHTLGDPLWWILIFENFFNLAAILTLSTKTEYLVAETPFLLGAILPIVFDGIMLFAISSWHRRWARLDTPAARHAKEAEALEAEVLDLLRSEQEDAVTEQRIRNLLLDAEAEPPALPEGADRKERRKIEAQRRKVQILQADYRRYEAALHVIKEQLRQRKEKRARVKLELSTHLQDLEVEKIEAGL